MLFPELITIVVFLFVIVLRYSQGTFKAMAIGNSNFTPSSSNLSNGQSCQWSVFFNFSDSRKIEDHTLVSIRRQDVISSIKLSPDTRHVYNLYISESDNQSMVTIKPLLKLQYRINETKKIFVTINVDRKSSVFVKINNILIHLHISHGEDSHICPEVTTGYSNVTGHGAMSVRLDNMDLCHVTNTSVYRMKNCSSPSTTEFLDPKLDYDIPCRVGFKCMTIVTNSSMFNIKTESANDTLDSSLADRICLSERKNNPDICYEKEKLKHKTICECFRPCVSVSQTPHSICDCYDSCMKEELYFLKVWELDCHYNKKCDDVQVTSYKVVWIVYSFVAIIFVVLLVALFAYIISRKRRFSGRYQPSQRESTGNMDNNELKVFVKMPPKERLI